MNKHLLKTRLASVAHYTEEIKKLNEAKKATEETREAVVQSLKEFFPFEAGQVLINGDKVRKLDRVGKVCLNYSNDVVFWVYLFLPGEYGFAKNSTQSDWNLTDLEDWKVVYEPKAADND